MKEYRKLEMVNMISKIVATGSVDGVATTAAALRTISNNFRRYGEDVDVEFTQAFQVDKIDPSAWESGQKILFVDLAVNNQNPSMTVEFLRRISAAGHEIVGIADEHDADAWENAFADAGLDYFDELALKPVSQNKSDIKSSGALLREWLEGYDGELEEYMCRHNGHNPYQLLTHDSHVMELLDAADAGDRMDFSTHFGGLINQAVKSKIWDNSRRVHLAKHFAKNYEPDETILNWVAEYEAILETHKEIIADSKDLGDKICRINAVGKVVDMTTLMSQLYKEYKVVIVEGEVFNKDLGKKEVMVSFGCESESGLNILQPIKDAGISAGGFASKANIALADEAAAIEAVRAALTA